MDGDRGHLMFDDSVWRFAVGTTYTSLATILPPGYQRAGRGG